MMEIEAPRRGCVFDRIKGQPMTNQVCVFWLEGRCNRNPCKFMHRQSSPPQPELPHLASSNDNNRKQSNKITWRNPNYHIHKTSKVSTNERARTNGNRSRSTQHKMSGGRQGKWKEVVGHSSFVQPATYEYFGPTGSGLSSPTSQLPSSRASGSPSHVPDTASTLGSEVQKIFIRFASFHPRLPKSPPSNDQ